MLRRNVAACGYNCIAVVACMIVGGLGASGFPGFASAPVPGMTGNGTCAASPSGGDCNAMRSGSFPEALQNLSACVAKASTCKYGNYVSFTQGGFGCSWYESCDFEHLCVDCSAPKPACPTVPGRCPSYIPFISEIIRIGPPPNPPLPNFTCSTPPSPSPTPPPTPPPSPPSPPPPVTGTPWEGVGPWNIFDDKNNNGESGTLASAASPKANPNLIYTGGHNNGASSGILKTVDGGVHWTKNSTGIWDTHIYGIFIHPSDPQGSHVLVGTGTGVYESKDFAASWQLINETESWQVVTSFVEVTIGGEHYIVCKSGNSIGSVPVSGGVWQKSNTAPGSFDIGPLTAATTAGKTEIVDCINSKIYYGTFETPTHVTWKGPINYTQNVFDSWVYYNHQTYDIYDYCPTPTTCKAPWHYVGNFTNVTDCQITLNSTNLGYKVAAYTFKGRMPGKYFSYNYTNHCYASDNFETWVPPHGAHAWDPPQVQEDTGQSYSGRGPGEFPVNSTEIGCFNAAVDPNDRNHFIYSQRNSNSNWASFDGGATVVKNSKENHGAFYVAIDSRGWSYTASEGGAYVTRDNGTTWDALHVIMHERENNTLVDRVMHDYQFICTGFRGDGVAFPSDQGLFILDGNSNALINADGDLHNNIATSALISPSKDGKSRNIVVNLWDWNQAFTIDDGATWRGWLPTEAAPYSCGEGGWGFSLGASGYQIMFHHTNWWHTSDGGYNFIQTEAPGNPGLGFDYVRKQGSLVEPAGTCFALMTAPAGPEGEPVSYDSKRKKEREHEAHLRMKQRLKNGVIDVDVDPNPSTYIWLLTSENFGLNFTWTVLPDKLQTCGAPLFLAADPTKDNSMFVVTTNCLAQTTDNGKTWSSCLTAPGLEGPFHELVIKSTEIMFMFRPGLLPLKTVDGGATWVPMSSLAPLYVGNSPLLLMGSLSWTGKTLVVHGNDRSTIQRHEFGTVVWKSTDDGETWTDETGDLATISMGHGRWYESDFYIITAGQGVIVKRNFE